MNWDDLRLFLGLARSGRVGASSKGLGVDPTTLIRRVKKLEDSLNCKLFELTTKGYVLTDRGVQLVSYIEKAEHAVLEAQSELNNERGNLTGTVRVSVSEGFGTWFLAPLLVDFKRLYPNICIELVATNGFLNLTKREADIAILLERPTKGLLITKRLSDYQFNLYCHQALLTEHGEPKSLDELSDFNLVSYVPDLIYAPQLKFIEETALSQLNALRSTSINAQYQMLINGAGIGILPKFIAEQQSGLQRILENKMQMKRTFWLATHQENQNQAKFQVFITWLTEQVSLYKKRFLDGS